MAPVFPFLLAGVEQGLAARKAAVPYRRLVDQAHHAAPVLPITPLLDQDQLCIIADIKSSSPLATQQRSSRALAQAVCDGGADLLACSTHTCSFRGGFRAMQEMKQETGLPLLNRDLIVDPYQIYEMRVYGTDVISLRCAFLSESMLTEMLMLTHSLGMNAMVEVRNQAEAEIAVRCGARILGVNARDMEINMMQPDRFGHIAPHVPADIRLIALSGVKTVADLRYYAQHGARAVVIGNAIVQDKDPERATRRFCAAAMHPTYARNLDFYAEIRNNGSL